MGGISGCRILTNQSKMSKEKSKKKMTSPKKFPTDKYNYLRIYRKDFPKQFSLLVQTGWFFVLLTLNASVADMCWMVALSRIKASNTLLIYSFHCMLVGLSSHYIFHDPLNHVQSGCLSNPIYFLISPNEMFEIS